MKRAAALVCAVATLAGAREAAAACDPRPTDMGGALGYSFDGETVQTFAGSKVKITYATTGANAVTLASTRTDAVPDTVALAASLGDDAITRYTQMGFRAPPSDNGCGGDDLLDIYLVHFAGSDGSTEYEQCAGRTCASWILVEATFNGRGYANATEGFTTVVPHELFHAVQGAYDSGLDHFWSEGTAQWGMKTLHPEIMDLERNLPGFFSQSSRSIDTPPGGAVAEFVYGSAVWPVFLNARFDADVIRQTLEKEVTGLESLAAVDQATMARKSSLAIEFPMFVAWNACTRDRAGTGGYAEAATYPSISPAPATLDGTAMGITTGLSNFTYTTSADALSQVTLATDATRNGALLVPLVDGKCQLDKAAVLPATFQGDAIVVVTGVTTKKTDAPFTLTVAAAPMMDAGAGNDAGGTSPASPTTTGSSSGCSASSLPSGLGGAWLLSALGVMQWRRRRTPRS